MSSGSGTPPDPDQLWSHVCEHGPVLDDATRRQLRFSLFLQGFAALMMATALVIRATSVGLDAFTGLFALGVVLIGAAAIWTISRLRSG